MNAPASSAALAAPVDQVIAIASIQPSATHIQELRRARFDKKLLAELAESIKVVGVLQPIVARPAGKDRYEIVAGERRWLAAKLAGLNTIRASVADLTDEQVLEVQLIENLQREGLHELEEAEGYEELMKLKKISADTVADMVGRSRSYVFKRTKLLALCKEARAAFYAGEMDASTALLIARIPAPELQKKAMAELKEQREYGDIQNFKDASAFIRDNYMLRLKQAPFDIADANLVPKAGTCQACPKRTGNQKDLFGDVKEADLCTDAKCFDEKRQAHYAVAVRKLEVSGKKIIHGDAAKKLLPNWETNSNANFSGGYVSVEEYSYDLGCKVGDALPQDYEPVLVQHPGTGKILEAVTKQAVTKAKLSKGGKRKTPSSRAAKVSKPKGPDVDEQLLERLVKLIYEKAPKELGKAHLQVLATRLLSHLNTRDHERQVVAKQFGWPAKSFSSGGYYSSAKLPADALKLDQRGLVLMMLELTFLADRYHRKTILDLFGVNEDKTRELIIEERKAAAKAARDAKKKGKAK